MFGLIFGLLWLWVLVLGVKGVVRRVNQMVGWLYTPWGESSARTPMIRGPIGQSWDADEYRHYATLAAREPVPAIPQVTREMEQALDQERRTAEQIGRDIDEWRHAIDQLKRSAEDWTEKAALALSKGRNDLGRAAILERQKTQQRIADLEKDVAEMSRMLTSHASDIQSLETKLSTIYRRNHMAETRLSAAESSARTRQLLYGEHVKDALSRFDELERDADQAEGRAEALAMKPDTASDRGSLDAQLNELAVEAELAALKPKAGFGRKGVATPQ